MPNATCGVVLDRHVPKNAGTTVRSMLKANAGLGMCTYIGYDVGRTWESRVGFHHHSLAELARDELTPDSRKRYCIEAHMVGETFWADLHAVHASPYAVTCRVIVFIRVREPLSWYKSYYSWAVFSRQQRGQLEEWGANFTDWLPPNMQCRFLLHGTNGQGSEWAGDMAKARRTWPQHLTATRWRQLERNVRAADVLAPLDRLDESLALVRHLSGILRTSTYKTTVPQPMHGPWERQPKTWHVEKVRDFCMRVDCAEAVRRRAPDDHRLYELTTELFDEQWRTHCSDGRCTYALPPPQPASETLRPHHSGRRRGQGTARSRRDERRLGRTRRAGPGSVWLP